MKQRERNTLLKRGITLLLAILMTLGLMAPAFTSFAAMVLVVESYSEDKVKVEGEPNPEEWSVGEYHFEIQEKTAGGEGLQLSITKPEKTIPTVFDIQKDKEIEYEGVSIEKKATPDGVTEWVKGDKFTISFKMENTGATPGEGGEPVVSYPRVSRYSTTGSNDRNANNITKVTKGNRVNIFVDVTDTKYLYDENENYKPYVILDMGAFSQSHTSAANRIVATKGVSGKLEFEIDLIDLLYSGKGDTVKFRYGYTVGDENIEHSLTISIAECKEYIDRDDDEDDEDDEDVKLDPLVPHIIISNYDYGTQQVVAGQVFDLNLTFTNTSDRYDLDNIVMKITTPEGFSIASSSNTFYFSQLDHGESISKTVSVQANPSAKAESHALTIAYEFQYVANDTRRSGESSESISIPISQPDRFSVGELQLPTSLYVGDEYNLSLNFVNKGKAEIYNVTAELRGNVSNAGERTFVGNVASGTENSVDFYVTPQEGGQLEGEILLTYEDSNMNVKEVVRPFVIPVEEYPVFEPDPGMMEGMDPMGPAEPQESSLFTLPNMILGVVMLSVAGMTAYMTILKTKAKRSEFDDEDL